MNTLYDHQRLAPPASGFGLSGLDLFEGRPLGDILKEKSDEQVLDAISFALAAIPFSKLSVRRALIKASAFTSPIELVGEASIQETRPSVDVRFSATIDFTGDASLFHAKVARSSRRALRARVEDDQLVVLVRSPAANEPMVPYAIASEIIAIREVLAEQLAVITDHNRVQADYWRSFVEERWGALCAMRPFARETVDAWARNTRRELLELYDLLFSESTFLD